MALKEKIEGKNVLTINRNLQKTVDSLMTTNESLEKIKKRLIMGV